MSTLRTHSTFRVDTWTPDGESIVEHVASVEDYQVALATYRACAKHLLRFRRWLADAGEYLQPVFDDLDARLAGDTMQRPGAHPKISPPRWPEPDRIPRGVEKGHGLVIVHSDCFSFHVDRE